MDSTLQRVLRAWLISLLALVPLLIFPIYMVKDVVFVGFVSLAALGWLWLSIVSEKHELQLTFTNCVLAYNVLIWIASLIFSPFPNEGLHTLSLRFAGLGFLLLSASLLGRKQDLKKAVGVLLATAGVMSIYGILQFLRLDPFSRTSELVGHFRAGSLAGHPNFFITFLTACIPLNIIAFRLFAGSFRSRILLGVSLLINLGAAAATLSRAGWGGLAVSLTLTLVGLRFFSRRSRGAALPTPEASRARSGKTLIWLIPLVLLMVGLLAVLSHSRLDPGERERLVSLGGVTTQTRLLTYKAALNMAADSPVLGKGLGTFGIFYPQFRPPETGRFFPRNEYSLGHAVCEPLEVLAESGGLGLLGWLLLVGVLVGRPLRALKRVEDPGLQALMIAGAAGTLGVTVHGLAEVCLRNQPGMFMFWAMPALAFAAERAGTPSPAPVRSLLPGSWAGRLGLSAVIGMVFGLAFAVILSDFVATLYVASGRKAQAASKVEQAEQAYRRGISAWAGNLEARYLWAGTLWRLGHLERAEAAYRELIARSPFYHDVNHNLARVLLAQQKPQQARRWAQIAVRLNPFHMPSHELAVRLALKEGKLKQAEGLAWKMLEKANGDALSHISMARVRKAQGDMPEARQILLKAAKRFPKIKAVRRELRRLNPR